MITKKNCAYLSIGVNFYYWLTYNERKQVPWLFQQGHRLNGKIEELKTFSLGLQEQ